MRNPFAAERPDPGSAARSRGDNGGSAFSRRHRLHAASLLALVVVAGCRDAETSLTRGDRLWADSNFTAALAEYRLSWEVGRSDDVLARVAHSYAMIGQFERARESYDQLLRSSPHYADQAVFDYLQLARRAQERNDRYGMAGALEAALALRPGLHVEGMAAPLARYYARAGDGERARDFFERALASAPADSVADLLFDYAQLQETGGNCVEAMELFNAYRTRVGRGERSDQARWSIGNCAFQLGREARQAGDPERALTYLQTTLDLGLPQNLIEQAWFERGEALVALGRRDEALDAYVRVLETVRTPGGQLADRARQRIDELRFGRDSDP
jgi:tetratricopeptide (TPR) repeat protein